MAGMPMNWGTKLRNLAKNVAFPVLGLVVGVVLEVLFGWAPIDTVKGWLASPGKLGLHVDTTSHMAVVLLSIVAGPAVGLVAGWKLARLPLARTILDKLFPDPPIFVRSDLVLERQRTMTLLEGRDGKIPEMLGRESEIARLLDFAHTPNTPFLWQAVVGPTGIGKSRLAVEWLDVLRREGWDVGVMDRRAEFAPNWRPRRRTALVIDEAGRNWGSDLGSTVAALQSCGRIRAPVRLLVLDQNAPAVDHVDDGIMRQMVRGACNGEPLIVPPLADDAVLDLWSTERGVEASVNLLQAKTGGRPRAIILLARRDDATSYAAALVDWAASLIPELSDSPGVAVNHSDGALLRSLAFAALAAPVRLQSVVEIIGEGFDPHRLARFFPYDDFQDVLPAFAPEDLGQEILLRGLAYLGSVEAAKLITAAVAANSDSVENVLWSLWRSRPEADEAIAVIHCLPSTASSGVIERAKVLAAIQITFDRAYPERAATLNLMMKTLVDELVEISAPPEINTALFAIAARRPHDFGIQLEAARGAIVAIHKFGEAQLFPQVEEWADWITALYETKAAGRADVVPTLAAGCARCAMTHYGEARQFTELERWGARLIAIADSQRASPNPEIWFEVASGAFAAILHYGEARQFDDMERWGSTITAIADTAVAEAHIETLDRCANAAQNAVAYYGEVHLFEQLERWGAWLIALAQYESNKTEPLIGRCEAHAARNAMSDYGDAQRFDDLERWGARLLVLAETEPFAADPVIRLAEARGAVNVISDYGEAGHFDDLERWGARLVALAETEPFSSNSTFRHEEAKGAGNAILHYGAVERFDDVERWGSRVVALAESSIYATDPEVRRLDAVCAVNAAMGYGKAGRFDDTERWGARVVAVAEAESLAASREIRRLDAQCASNAIFFYGRASRFDDVERWFGRLMSIMEGGRFKTDPVVMLQIAQGATNIIATCEYSVRGSIRSKGFAMLARCARFCENDVKIQSLAGMCNLSYIQQMEGKWPFGRW